MSKNHRSSWTKEKQDQMRNEDWEQKMISQGNNWIKLALEKHKARMNAIPRLEMARDLLIRASSSETLRSKMLEILQDRKDLVDLWSFYCDR